MSNKVVGNKPAFRFWFSIYAFTAFIMAVAVAVFAWLASESRKEAGEGRTANAPPIAAQSVTPERLQLLAHFDPPPYSPATESSAPRGFAMAMERYSLRDFAGAIPGLRAVAPDFVPARFYLGICLLLTNNRAGGIEQLRSVAGAPRSPYVERARFYLAKALLANGDRTGAQQQLDNVIATQGEFEPQARVLLAQIH